MWLLIFDFVFNLLLPRSVCPLLHVSLHWQRSRMQNLQRVCKSAAPVFRHF